MSILRFKRCESAIRWRWPRWHLPEWGQGILEFAVVLPILLLVILLIIEASLIVQAYLAVEHAANEAVRWAITYQPVQGRTLDDEMCTNTSQDPPFLFENAGYDCDPYEGVDEYNARRVALIKERALVAAVGLRINPNALGMTQTDFNNRLNTPGFFGVRVWGFPSFESSEQLDHPGLPGLPVRVQVVHCVEMVDPLFRAMRPCIRVQATAEMINEGIQVGFGNLPPPTFNPPPTFVVTPPGAAATETPNPSGTPVGTPTPQPINYRVNITFNTFTVTLPLQRGHNVTVTVTDENSNPLPNVLVSFSTNFGAYGYSGVEPQYLQFTTDGNGQAIPRIYANQPGTANLRAWIDLDSDQAWDLGEPTDQATGQWIVGPGPYILASDHEVLPLDWISVSLYDHQPTLNPYRVLWCRVSGDGIPSAELLSGINVDAGTGDILGLAVEIPLGSSGYYRLESHTDGGDCGDVATLAGVSAEILATTVPPDLTISSFNIPADIQPNTPFLMSAVVSNLTPGESAETFDVDFYLDPPSAPSQGQMGVIKQWVSGITPYGTAIVTTVMWVDCVGPHQIWARVDNTNYVEETDEENNVNSISIMAQCPLEEHNGQVVIPALEYDSNVAGFYRTGWNAETNTGYRSPTGNYAYAGGGLTNPTNAYANDSAYASRDNNADGVAHVFRDYGFNIPANAGIRGIEVRLDWWLDSTAGTNRIFVYLSWDGGNSWTAARTAGTEATADGNPTNVVGATGTNTPFGRSWQPSDFSNENFRVRIELDTTDTSRDFRVDWVAVRVTYRTPTGRNKAWQATAYGGTPTMLVPSATDDIYSVYTDFDNPYVDGQVPPLLTYDVNFEHAGTYYVWMRGRPCTESARGCTTTAGNNDSVWVSLDGLPSSNAYRMGSWPAGDLTWRSLNMDGAQTTLVVPSPGVHQVQVRMREDSFEWSTIVLTTTAGGSGPTGAGPVFTCGSETQPPWYDNTKPPGLLECSQLLRAASFEGNPQNVFPPWYAGSAGAYQRTGYLRQDGAFSTRLHASLGAYPTCAAFSPYLYQTVQIPTEVYSLTHLTIEGYWAVGGSLAECSYFNTTDADDSLRVQMRDSAGNPISNSITIGDGSTPAETWLRFYVDVTNDINLISRAGQNLQVYFFGVHDQDAYGTWFYLDNLACNICTQWPIPDPEPGTASFGGLARTIIGGVPQPMPGVDVWAYTQGGQVLHTRSIQDGTYHFYNIPPGTYTIYAEAWIGGYLRMATSTVTVVADQRNYNVHLLLQ